MDVVDLILRKPCLLSARGKLKLGIGSRSCLRTLMLGQRGEIGRKEDARYQCLLALGIRLISSRFQIEGLSAACIDRL